ncbi:MAG TPA: UbiA family prenyltransferase [Anaerolineales bacterium]|nr:UbiA family prenyltransferase [Anaerolineales bacterium]
MPQPLPVGESIPYERVWVGNSKIKAIIALTHPTAVIIFSLITWILAGLTLSSFPRLAFSIPLVLAMAAAQASVGVFNEVFDWRLDKVTKPWRAIPAGANRPWQAAAIASILLCLGLLLAASISLLTGLLLLLGAGMGVLYSAKLKRNVFSWLPYVVNYPSFPVWVLVALDRFDPRVLIIYPLASLFAVAVHLCNQLRDFDADQALGLKGLVQHLGKRRSIAWCAGLLVLSPLPFLIVSGLPRRPAVFAVLLATGLLHWLLTVPLLLKPPELLGPGTFRTLFRRLQVSGPLMLVAWYWAFLQAEF